MKSEREKQLVGFPMLHRYLEKLVMLLCMMNPRSPVLGPRWTVRGMLAIVRMALSVLYFSFLLAKLERIRRL